MRSEIPETSQTTQEMILARRDLDSMQEKYGADVSLSVTMLVTLTSEPVKDELQNLFFLPRIFLVSL